MELTINKTKLAALLPQNIIDKSEYEVVFYPKGFLPNAYKYAAYAERIVYCPGENLTYKEIYDRKRSARGNWHNFSCAQPEIRNVLDDYLDRQGNGLKY